MSAQGSKSEGCKAFLCGDDGCEYQLYRKDMLPVNDPFFAPFENLHVIVKGDLEKYAEHTSMCVAVLTLDDGSELQPQPEQLFPSGNLFLSNNMSKNPNSPKRLPRRLKKLRKKTNKK